MERDIAHQAVVGGLYGSSDGNGAPRHLLVVCPTYSHNCTRAVICTLISDHNPVTRVYSIHDGIDATYTTFDRDGRKFIQVDSHGRADREIPGKKSQTFQLDEKSARELFDILRDCFHFR